MNLKFVLNYFFSCNVLSLMYVQGNNNESQQHVGSKIEKNKEDEKSSDKQISSNLEKTSDDSQSSEGESSEGDATDRELREGYFYQKPALPENEPLNKKKKGKKKKNRKEANDV